MIESVIYVSFESPVFPYSYLINPEKENLQKINLFNGSKISKSKSYVLKQEKRKEKIRTVRQSFKKPFSGCNLFQFPIIICMGNFRTRANSRLPVFGGFTRFEFRRIEKTQNQHGVRVFVSQLVCQYVSLLVCGDDIV